jgi:tocopherol cyclase
MYSPRSEVRSQETAGLLPGGGTGYVRAVLRRLLDAYRRTGADPPFADPARAHGTALEGYYWRVVDPAAGSVVVVLCGICQGRDGPWAAVALASHPGGFARHVVVAPASADTSRFGACAGDAVRGSAHALSAHLGDDAWVDLRFRRPRVWPGRVFGALGLGHAVPGLGQYWHPVVLSAEAEGEVCLGGVRSALDGATVYAEKNWGPSFAGHWWWGHAGAFPDYDGTVAFAGGRLGIAGRTVSPTVAVVRLENEVLRFAPPLARMRAAVGAGAWSIRGRTLRHAVEIDGEATGGSGHVLPVPDIAARRVDMRSTQHLAGRLRLHVSRGDRVLFEGESPLAGLERGAPATRSRASGG